MSVPKDGNCMFHAICSARLNLDKIPRKEKTIDNDTQLRALVISHLKMERNTTFNIGGIEATLEEHIGLQKNFDTYVSEMARRFTFGQEFELLICAMALEINIEVFCHGPQPLTYLAFPGKIRKSKSSPTIRLALTFRPDHYEWLHADPCQNESIAQT